VAFRRLLAGGLVSSLGGAMTSYAVTLQIWDLTRSSFAVGALGFTFIPVLLFGLLGGSVADSADRKRLALVTSVALMGVSALFALQSFADLGQLWILYVLALAQSMLQAIGAPARRTFIPALVPGEQLTAAIALNTLAGRITMLAGPALAGVVTGAFGLRACYLIDTVSFLAALYATARLPALRPARAALRPETPVKFVAIATKTTEVSRAPSRLRSTAEGLHYIRRAPVLLGSFLSDLDAMLFGLPAALFPALNAAHFGGSPQTLGLLNSAVGVGGLVSAVLSGRTARVRRQGLGMLVSTAIWGAAIAGFALVRSLPAALALLAVSGAADTLTVTFRSSIVQTITPDELRGRVSSVEFIIGMGGGPLGNVESGTVASLTGSATLSAFSGGVACLAGAVLIAVAFPALVRYGRAVPSPTSEPAVP
jgi:MFS family permease